MSKGTCVNIKNNVENCPCPATDCQRHAVCCECVSAHATKDSLPSCLKMKVQESEAFRKNIVDLVMQSES
jgi:hypothetical protein